MSTGFTRKEDLRRKKVRKIVYPDSDGRPMADNTRQFRWIVVIKEGLEILYRDRADVFVAGDLLWYAEEGKPKVRMSPDAMVVFGRPKGYRGSYMQWVEDGIAPQVVFEVHSPGNRRAKIEQKFRFYEQYGVKEYYYYNPDNGKLTGWRRSRGKLQPIADMDGYTSPLLNIRFEPVRGPDSLKIIRPDGQPFRTPVELAEGWELAEHRADTAEHRADAAEHRADAAENRADADRRLAAEALQRAERLAARLRELGEEID
ncbi:Uma2 family endonuclease [Aquisphaera insulae]|uniref:Uma2 family endonuclease n=1 Tax=Aquisphaera insulae TaxID=2712864 RepID=UPI0013ED7751|nr:Uma2 family endonuclease [Aquisphaera insulae]